VPGRTYMLSLTAKGADSFVGGAGGGGPGAGGGERGASRARSARRPRAFPARTPFHSPTTEDCLSVIVAGGVRITVLCWESANGTNELRGQFPALYIRPLQAA
jgi:hypothetical protein